MPAPEELPILPISEGVLFPRAAFPLTIGRPESVEMILRLGEGRKIGIIGQKDPNQDQPKPSDLCDVGTIGVIHRTLRTSKDHILVFCEGVARFPVASFTSTDPQLIARVEVLEDK